ncbi:MAG: hypothetical protein HC906_15955 [Bacteroidales bacterium]|nr:hypothetical protein [Bacteroidales bacterium]
MLEGLTPGSYNFLAHPAMDGIEMQGVKIGTGESVAFDRNNDYLLLKDTDVMKVIDEKNIELIGFKGFINKPSIPVLISPANESSVTGTKYTFAWSACYPVLEK